LDTADWSVTLNLSKLCGVDRVDRCPSSIILLPPQSSWLFVKKLQAGGRTVSYVTDDYLLTSQKKKKEGDKDRLEN
jgi:hypothetical protein